MPKKIFFILLFIILFFPLSDSLAGTDGSLVNIYFFWGEGCPHCAQEKPFLARLAEKYPRVRLHSFEVWHNKKSRQLLSDTGKKLGVNVSGVPFLVVGDKHFIGWYDEKSTGAAIEEAVQCALAGGCRDLVGEILAQERGGRGAGGSCACQEKKTPIPQKINVPVLGEIKINEVSLPALTILFGALDGFNPCAMWTLLFLISLLLGMQNRKRMWILGGAFIFASAFIYFLFMAAWLQLLLFIGFIFWVRVLIGLAALAAGGYNLRKYFVSPDSGCHVTDNENRRRVFQGLKIITRQRSFYLALGGIVLLAFAVNLVGFICSAGLPAVYTQVLILSHLARWQYYFYILFYIFIFMLDDMIVFVVAMVTMKMTAISAKYGRWSHLIGGILMLVIGLLLILKPEWLMFG